jgi:hypothetical protein
LICLIFQLTFLQGTEISVDEFSGTVTTLLELPTEVWAGTSTGGLAMFDKKTSQFIQYKLARNGESLRMPTKRTVLLTVGNCVWVAAGTEIDIISVKVSFPKNLLVIIS